MLRQKNIKLIIVTPPFTKARYRVTNTHEEIMKDKAKYIDYNKTLELNEAESFYDSHHLNQLGVNRFSERLVEDLRRLNYLDLR